MLSYAPPPVVMKYIPEMYKDRNGTVFRLNYGTERFFYGTERILTRNGTDKNGTVDLQERSGTERNIT